jgi:hypothetical protein
MRHSFEVPIKQNNTILEKNGTSDQRSKTAHDNLDPSHYKRAVRVCNATVLDEQKKDIATQKEATAKISYAVVYSK